MLNFEKIIKTATSRMEPIFINPQRCSKIRSPLSKCRQCIESCPKNGINIENKMITLNDNCIQCGLCASACPTGALSIQEPTELNLFNSIEIRGRTNSTVVLTCKYNKETSNNAFKVPCLGSLSLEFLLSIDILPFEINMVFCEENCSNCVVQGGINFYLSRINELEKIENDLKLVGRSIKNIKKSPKVKIKKIISDEEIDNERRKFLTSIFKSAKNIPNAAIKYLLGSNDDITSSNMVVENPTVRKHPLLARIALNLKEKELINIEISNYLQPSLVGICHFCRACSILCPMGALKYSQEGDNLNLVLLKDACSGCGLCTEICYYKALELKPKKIEEFSSKEPSMLALGTQRLCSICNQTITASQPIEFCSSCVKLGKVKK